MLESPIGPKPINLGEQPWTAVKIILPKISKLLSLAYCSSQISVTAAPSVSGEDVAAVTVPSWSNISLRPSKISWLLPDLMPPSFEQSLITVISFLKLPFDWASKAFWWLAIANSCYALLAIWYFFATFSAVVPIEK